MRRAARRKVEMLSHRGPHPGSGQKAGTVVPTAGTRERPEEMRPFDT